MNLMNIILGKKEEPKGPMVFTTLPTQPLDKLRPVHIIYQEGVLPLERKAVEEGISKLVKLAGVPIKIYTSEDLKMKESAHLEDYLSRDTRTREGHRQSNAQTVLNHLDGSDAYKIVVVKTDLYDPRTNFVIGMALENKGALISTCRFGNLNDFAKQECVKTETMHEGGHVFGLVPYERKTNVEESLGHHCANLCIMRQGLTVPKDWIKYTEERLECEKRGLSGLCEDCQKDLKNYFKK